MKSVSFMTVLLSVVNQKQVYRTRLKTWNIRKSSKPKEIGISMKVTIATSVLEESGILMELHQEHHGTLFGSAASAGYQALELGQLAIYQQTIRNCQPNLR